MSYIAVTCPECRRGFVVSGRGRCRCGAYLAHTWAGRDQGRAFVIPYPPERTYIWLDGTWQHAPNRAL